MVYYRKYRPQTIEELDSSEVRDKLYSVLKSSSVAHAFLFTGPKGLGKTSTARIVAKAVNCEKLKVESGKLKVKGKKNSQLSTLNSQLDIEPCNKCYQCISITNGTNIDVLEIDAASNRGIDEIRDLREKVRLSPATASKKIYIIDEVHMLTTEAFNALLKTLEEPPAHVIFVLCTTEPHKVPATIASRCFHILFKKASIEELVRSFQRIAEKEKLLIDKDALNFIASLSDGSFRDGAKILEEMAAYDKSITKELVQEKYQIRQLTDQISNMLEILAERDAKSGLKLVSQLVEQGVDMKYFIEQLISELHQMLLVEIGVNDAQGPVKSFPPASAPSTSSQMRAVGSPSTSATLRFNIVEIKELVELLSKAYGELKYAVLPQLPLELVIIEWSLVKQGSPHPLNDSLSTRGPATPFPPTGAPASLANAANAVRASGSPSSRVTPRSENDTDNFWQELISKVKLYNHSIAGVLRGCGLKSYDNKKIVIETGYRFHKERLDDEKTKAIIEKVGREIIGKPVAVSVVLKHVNPKL